jgi:hypothetical protein
MDADGQNRSAILGALFQSRSIEFPRCFAPEMACKRRAIRAHSVQNARALSLLVEDGHVFAPDLRFNAKSLPKIELRLTGRNRATTFAGLCAEHDREIFSPIETAEIDFKNPEHLFLLAYRATFYEIHATAVVGLQTQGFYQKRVQLGVDRPDDTSPAGMYATDRLITAYETYMYKAEFDKAYLDRNFARLRHDVILLDVERPTLAACALFSLDWGKARDSLVRVCLSILPLSENRTVAVFSYLPEDASQARPHLDRVIASSGAYQKYELSRQLLNRCQNFVLAPNFVRSWSPERHQRILDLFTRTVFEPDLQIEHPDLQLFT